MSLKDGGGHGKGYGADLTALGGIAQRSGQPRRQGVPRVGAWW